MVVKLLGVNVVVGVTVLLGNGGTVNASGDFRANNGSSGGNSTFSGPATAGPGILTALGGNGGSAANFLRSKCLGGCFINHEGVNGTGGNGGGGSNATTTFIGGNGAAGVHSGGTNDRSGAGGGGAGTSANGGNATGTTTGGLGGSTGGGNGANGIVQPFGSGYLGTNGINGNTIGGAGGGACGHNRQASSNAHRSNVGGNGARGEVRITFAAASPGIISVSSPTILCNTPTVQSVVTYTNGATTFTWSGPGIIFGSNTGTVTVNLGGVYSYTASAAGCATEGTVAVTTNTTLPSTTTSNCLCTAY